MESSNGLHCNYQQCRKSITGRAWVTSCNHIFCHEDGERELVRASAHCPVCDSALLDKLDVLRIDLDMSDQYRTMMLLGYPPETVLDIATRAIMFWGRQVCEERAYEKGAYQRAKDSVKLVENYYESMVATFQEEIKTAQQRSDDLKSQMQKHIEKIDELTQNLAEKSRQCIKLQAMYDSFRRQTVTEKASNKFDVSMLEKTDHKTVGSPFLHPYNAPRRGVPSPVVLEASPLLAYRPMPIEPAPQQLYQDSPSRNRVSLQSSQYNLQSESRN